MAAGIRSTTDQARAFRSWARELKALPSADPLAVVEFVVQRVAAAYGAALEGDLDSPRADGLDRQVADVEPPPGGWANPWLPGVVHEQVVSAANQSDRGAWYTPEITVRGLVALATADGRCPELVVDPACGGGAFLLAALDRMVELGVAPGDAIGRVAGLDIDGGAVAVTRWSLALWAIAHGLATDAATAADVVCGDALVDVPERWAEADLVVGNPPFGSPLRSGAVPATAEAFRVERADLLGPYCDLAAMHLLAAVERAAPGSAVAMVLPQSVLSGRDTAPLRDHLARHAPLRALWVAREAVFDAGVRACAVVLAPGGDRSSASVRLAAGPEVKMLDQTPDDVEVTADWAAGAARAMGAPDLPPALNASVTEDSCLGAMASATAGFRDEFYGLVEACVEWDGPAGKEPNRLLTVGSVEPLATKWGRSEVRFGGAARLQPTVEVERLSPRVAAWVERQSRPKLVVATQSKILEPEVDPTGRLIPATPLLAVHAEPDVLARVAAVFLAPPVVAWAWRRWFGAALSVDALKLAARQVAELPLPQDDDRWDQAARLVADGADPDADLQAGWDLSIRVARLMNEAYRADHAVFDWWLARAGGSKGDR